MVDVSTERECPFCKESIKAAAVICHYCQSGITPAGPNHGGICPYCAESVKEDAIKCRHCKSMIGPVPAEMALRTASSWSCEMKCGNRHIPGTSDYYTCLQICKIIDAER